MMETQFNILDIKMVENELKDEIQLTDKIVLKLRYPRFSSLNQVKESNTATDLAFDMIVSSIEYLYDGQQFYYARDTSKEELQDFIESLNQEQFSRIENFFDSLPKLNKTIEMDCNKCGFHHSIEVEGLENFFG